MDEHLQRLFEQHKLVQYIPRLAELGLKRIHDLHHIEVTDLIDVGMGKIQIRAFEKIREASKLECHYAAQTPELSMPLRSISKQNIPAPPNHSPPDALLPVPSPQCTVALSKHPPLARVHQSPAPPNHYAVHIYM